MGNAPAKGPIGHTRWAIADNYIPSWSHGPEPEMASHEGLSILNTGDREVELRIVDHGKGIYIYDDAGHGFWYYHAPMYRPQQAMDAWNKVFIFFGENLS